MNISLSVLCVIFMYYVYLQMMCIDLATIKKTVSRLYMQMYVYVYMYMYMYMVMYTNNQPPNSNMQAPKDWSNMIQQAEIIRSTKARMCTDFVQLQNFSYLQVDIDEEKDADSGVPQIYDLVSLRTLLVYSCKVTDLRLVWAIENDCNSVCRNPAVIEGGKGNPSVWKGHISNMPNALRTINEQNTLNTTCNEMCRTIEKALDVWCGRKLYNREPLVGSQQHWTYEIATFLIGVDNGLAFSMFVDKLRGVSATRRVQSVRLLTMLLGISLKLGSTYNEIAVLSGDTVSLCIDNIVCIHPCWSLISEITTETYTPKQFIAICTNMYHTSMWAYSRWESAVAAQLKINGAKREKDQ
jgi:hypothetical protein